VTSPDQAALRRRLIWAGTLGLLFALCQIMPALDRQAQLLSYPRLNAPLMPADPDIWIYVTQTRQWIADALNLAGHAPDWFYDHIVRRTNAPAGGIAVHWTRPMQLLLALFYVFTPAPPGLDLRVLLAANWLPPVMCLLALGFIAGAARRHFRHGGVLALSVLLMLLNIETAKNFAPGNADHHGLLSLLWCAVLYLLLDANLGTISSAVLGAVLGLMAWISVEALVLISFVFGLMGLDALLRPGRARLLAIAAAALAVTASFGLLFEAPLAQSFEHPVYDEISIVYVTLFWLVAAATGAMALAFGKAPGFQARIIAGGACAGAVLLAMYGLYPKVYKGPLVDADPFVSSGFHPVIGEMKPLFQIPGELITRELAWPLLAAVLLGSALFRGRMREDKRRYLLALTALLLGTTLCMIAENRWAYYTQPVAMVAIAALLPGLGAVAFPRRWKLPALPRSWRPWRWLGLAYVLLLLATHIHPESLDGLYRERQDNAALCFAQLRYVVQSEQLQPLLGSGALTLFTPENAGGDVLYFTPYKIIATNLHREGAELAEMRHIETLTKEGEALALLRKRRVDALLFCPVRYEADSWLRKIGEAKKFPYALTPVSGLKFLDIPGPRPVLLRRKE
jgi:hypothetical protein